MVLQIKAQVSNNGQGLFYNNKHTACNKVCMTGRHATLCCSGLLNSTVNAAFQAMQVYLLIYILPKYILRYSQHNADTKLEQGKKTSDQKKGV